MQDIVIFGRNVPALIYAPVIYFIWVSLLLVLKKVIFSRIQKFAEKTTSKLDDILLGALDLPLTLLVFVSGATVLEKIAPIIGDGELTRYFVVALKATTVVAIVLFLDKLFKNLIQA